MVRKLPRPESGYVGIDLVMRDSLEDHLVAEVREMYALERFPPEELDARLDAALHGDWAKATDSPFRPARLTYRYY